MQEKLLLPATPAFAARLFSTVVPARPGRVPRGRKAAREAATPGTAANRDGGTAGDTPRTFHQQTGGRWLQASG